MTIDFYVLTQRRVVGPFNGVELREAALAGILRPDGIIGASPEGPWYQAREIGLFSEQGLPLPHPSDVHVPHFQVDGMPGAFQGPFKLRELIGFAARGMLPPEALLDCDHAGQWIPADKYRILRACLRGDLILIDAQGRLIKRNITPDQLDLDSIADARAPIDLVRTVNQRDRTTHAPDVSEDDRPASTESGGSVTIDISQRPRPRRPKRWRQRVSEWKLAQRLRAAKDAVPMRAVVQAFAVILVLMGIASAYTYWQRIGLSHEQILGEWLNVQGDVAAFGIAFHDDGTCIIVNRDGPSWTGQYEWESRREDTHGWNHTVAFSAVVDDAKPQHKTDVILPTDGYVRFQGYAKDRPQLDGQPVTDLFLRRQSDALWLGYLTKVKLDRDGRELTGAWMHTKHWNASRSSMESRLRALDVEYPVPAERFGGVRPAHISDAIEIVRHGREIEIGPDKKIVYETLAYSDVVDPGYLVAQFGFPDEARSLRAPEIPQLPNGPSFQDAQVLRYNDLRFIFSPRGKLLYLTTTGPSSSRLP